VPVLAGFEQCLYVRADEKSRPGTDIYSDIISVNPILKPNLEATRKRTLGSFIQRRSNLNIIAGTLYIGFFTVKSSGVRQISNRHRSFKVPEFHALIWKAYESTSTARIMRF